MMAETMDEIILISLRSDSVLGRKSGKDTTEESRVELEENFHAKHSALSAADDNN